MSDYSRFNEAFCWRCGKPKIRKGSVCHNCYEEFCEMVVGKEEHEGRGKQKLIERGYMK